MNPNRASYPGGILSSSTVAENSLMPVDKVTSEHNLVMSSMSSSSSSVEQLSGSTDGNYWFWRLKENHGPDC